MRENDVTHVPCREITRSDSLSYCAHLSRVEDVPVEGDHVPEGAEPPDGAGAAVDGAVDVAQRALGLPQTILYKKECG